METVLDNMGLIVGSIIIAIFIIVMFSYVIKVVKFIKTDKIHDTVKRKLRKPQLTTEQEKRISYEDNFSYTNVVTYCYFRYSR
tara:strand:+ start:273 stop:521 length:249 start_codon:yes stop_codon:yes gene_type:complete